MILLTLQCLLSTTWTPAVDSICEKVTEIVTEDVILTQQLY